MFQQKRRKVDFETARIWIEREAAFKISVLLLREMGLSSCDAEAELSRTSLTIRLRSALTPMGRMIIRTEGGVQIVQGAYEALHDACRERLYKQVTQIVGQPVFGSRIEVAAGTEDIFVQFTLDPSLSLSSVNIEK